MILFPKKFIPLYLKDLKFLITRCCWKVTKIYSYFTFEQSRFKRGFVLTNQRSRQNVKNAIEKDFFTLMNNANFGYDCRNNLNNAKFEPIIDKINEISYIKKYYNLFDNKVSNFVNSDILERQIEQNFQQQIANVRHDNAFRSAGITSIKNQVNDERDALECLKNEKKKSKKRKLTKDVEIKLSDAIKNKKIKTMIDSDKNDCNSVKSIAIKGNTTIEVTSRFIKGKMLMFSKVSIRSCTYDLIDVFCFPDETVKEIYCQNSIIKCHLYLNLTDTNSCSISFNFICKKNVKLKKANPET